MSMSVLLLALFLTKKLLQSLDIYGKQVKKLPGTIGGSIGLLIILVSMNLEMLI